MTTKLFGEPRSSGSRTSGSCAASGRYVDDVAVGPDALHAAVLRSPHAHARILDIDVDDVLDVEGVHAVWTYDDLDRPDGRAAAAADPAPGADPRPHAVRAGQATRSTTSARRSRSWSPTTATSPRTPSAGSGSTTSSLPPVVGIEAARAADAPRARRRARQRRRPAWSRRTATPAAAIAAAPHTLEPRPDHRAQRLHADGGPRHASPAGTPTIGRLQVWTSTQTSTGVRAAVAAKLGLDLGQVDVITPDVGGGFGVKINHPWPEELLVPLAARRARPAGEVDRGPPRALHLLAPTSAARCTTSRSASTTTAGCSGSTCSSGTTTAPTRRTA